MLERTHGETSGVLKPRDAAEVEAAVQDALGAGRTLEVVGRGSKRAIGRAAQWDATLDLSGLTGVTLYEPAELVLSARAGTPLAEIEALVAEHDQELSFEPMDYGPLLGLPPGQGTLGGAVAVNLSGPRRVKAGAARDHFLGFTAVSGRGETFKSGGRVVKNVTGYDLPKLMAGSWGTLAAMTDVTVKVLPRMESEETLLLHGLRDAEAIRAMSLAAGSAGEISAAAHLPASAATAIPSDAVTRAAGPVTVIRLEGVPPSIAHRRALLRDLLRGFGEITSVEKADSRALWRAIRDAVPFAPQGSERDGPVWRISTTPMRGAEVVARITAAHEGTAVFYDWAGGLIWAMLPRSEDAGASAVRTAVALAGGHATLVRAPAQIRAAVAVFEPEDAGLATLTKRVKESFDPRRILNPGRMYAGI